jgi:hypothetical protein
LKGAGIAIYCVQKGEVKDMHPPTVAVGTLIHLSDGDKDVMGEEAWHK